jgi:hypothetical protein
MENKDKPAFPVLELKEMGDKFLLDLNAEGLSKREYYAAMAMQGLLANPHQDVINLENIAAAAVMHADDLLIALSKPQP